MASPDGEDFTSLSGIPQMAERTDTTGDDRVAAAQALKSALADLSAVDPERKTIVVCDDEAANRRMIVRALAGRGALPEGIKVNSEFADGRQLIEYLRNGANLAAVAAIVSDYNMPSKDGADVAEFLRKELGDRLIAFVMATARLTEVKRGGVMMQTVDDRVDGLVKGGDIDGVLGKPFEPPDLPRTVAQAIHRRLLLRSMAPGASGAFDVEDAVLEAARRVDALSAQQARAAGTAAASPANPSWKIKGLDPFDHRRGPEGSGQK